MTRAVMRLLIAAFVLSFAVPTIASASGVPYVHNVSWRNSLAAVAGGYADSSDMGAVGTAAAHYDTSVAIALFDQGGPKWVLPDQPVQVTANDSIPWLKIVVAPITTSPTVGADSIYLAIQASEDGITWHDTTPTSLFFVTSSSSNTFNGAQVIEQSSSNQFTYVIKQRISAANAGAIFWPIVSSATALTWQQLYGVAYIRLIVHSDVTGRYDAKLYGFVASE